MDAGNLPLSAFFGLAKTHSLPAEDERQDQIIADVRALSVKTIGYDSDAFCVGALARRVQHLEAELTRCKQMELPL